MKNKNPRHVFTNYIYLKYITNEEMKLSSNVNDAGRLVTMTHVFVHSNISSTDMDMNSFF